MRVRLCLGILLWVISTHTLCAQAYRTPTITDSLKEQTLRAAYYIDHFWDNADWGNDTLLSKPKLALDYLYVLRLLPDKDIERSLEQSVRLFSDYPRQFSKWLFWIERYLHDPRSPYFSDEMFLWVVDAVLQTSAEDEFADIWLRTREVLEKNRIGQRAEDFSFIDKDGEGYRLYNINAPLLMVIFNKPGCSRCQKTEEILSQNDTLQHFLEEGMIKILAICLDVDYEEWMEHQYPKEWICGYDQKGEIEDEMLYEIRQYPSIYLLDREKRVLLKEADCGLALKTLFSR